MDHVDEDRYIDFYYRPKPITDNVAVVEEDETSLQVAIALQQLKRLQAYSSDPQLKSLFVRWTIHNWATQGPFNIDAYQETLASFFAAQACSQDISSDAELAKGGETRKEGPTTGAETRREAESATATLSPGRRVSCSPPRRRSRPLDHVPLGCVAGAGSVIIAPRALLNATPAQE